MNKFILILFLVVPMWCSAQLEKVVVETYYVSDSTDATDTIGGGVEAGSVTFRIYVDMAPGSYLKGIYGDTEHPFDISSTQVFFNHKTDGQTFAKDFIKARYGEGTVALDTWLTLGQTAKKQGTITHYGVLKPNDDNGTFIGGINNDGGSEIIVSGLLTNNASIAGIPLTTADGMDTLNFTPAGWVNNGVLDFVSGVDSTIFGSVVPGTAFHSNAFQLYCDSVYGVVPDSNQVLIAQLTTKGELNFTLNVEVAYQVDGVWQSVKYVGTNVTINNEVYNPFLSYPYTCGCNDPAYFEYNPSAICLEEGSCVNLIRFGCQDSMACNYDPSSNFHINELCCYPGWCAGRDIEEVCPGLKGDKFDIVVFPVPASDVITLTYTSGVTEDIDITIVSAYGVTMNTLSVSGAPFNYSKTFNISSYAPGLYNVIVRTANEEKNIQFLKL